MAAKLIVAQTLPQAFYSYEKSEKDMLTFFEARNEAKLIIEKQVIWMVPTFETLLKVENQIDRSLIPVIERLTTNQASVSEILELLHYMAVDPIEDIKAVEVWIRHNQAEANQSMARFISLALSGGKKGKGIAA